VLLVLNLLMVLMLNVTSIDIPLSPPPPPKTAMSEAIRLRKGLW